jgi:hypothetical protein
MSTERVDTVDVERGARYARDRGEWEDIGGGPEHECLNCGSDVLELADGGSPDVAREICRVFGDEGGNVFRCPACTAYGRLAVAARKGIRIETGGVTLMGANLGGEI